MERLSRRRFIEDSLLALGAAAIPGAAFASESGRGRRVGPNEKLRVAVIGCGPSGRGMSHLNAFAGFNDTEVVAFCDADSAMFERAVKAVESKTGKAPYTTQDMRRIMDDKNIDIVTIATPNHWHALPAIWAMQAGKDVYCEKPVSHNVWEGRKIVEAARKYNKICQTGTQSRSNLQEPMKFLHDGGIGKIYLSRGLCYKPRPSIGKVAAPQPVPNTVDYSLYCGPAPMKPVMRSRFHYDWHWQWDMGNGDVGNQGIHEMDKARWGLNKRELPKSVWALGGRFGYEDDGETPNTMLTFMDYGDCQLIFEVRGLKTDELRPKSAASGAKVGNLYYGDKGVMVVPSYNNAVVYDNDGNRVREFRANNDHFRNFVDAVRSRKVSDLTAEIEEGHLSSALCHLGNISYKIGELVPFSSRSKSFGDHKEAAETFGRFEEHLTANDVKLTDVSYRLGRKLEIEPGKERFKGDKDANALLTREYRPPFVVPAKV